MDVANCFRNSIIASSPNENVAVGVSGQDIPGEAEGQAGHILRFVPLIEEAGLSRQGEAGVVQVPEVDVALAAADDHADLERVELGDDDRLCGAFCLGDFRTALTPRPVPNAHGVITALVDGYE